MPLAYRYSDQTETWHNNEAKKRDPAIALGIFCNQHKMKKKNEKKVVDQYLACPLTAEHYRAVLHVLFMNSAKTSPVSRK